MPACVSIGSGKKVDFHLFDEAAPTASRLLYSDVSPASQEPTGPATLPALMKDAPIAVPLHFAARKWTLAFTPAPGHFAAQAGRRAWIAFTATMADSLASMLVQSQTSNQRLLDTIARALGRPAVEGSANYGRKSWVWMDE